jgi:hypothetical protein
MGSGVGVDGPERGIYGEDSVGVGGGMVRVGGRVVVMVVGEDVVWLEGEEIVRLGRGGAWSGGVRVGGVGIEVEMIHWRGVEGL